MEGTLRVKDFLSSEDIKHNTEKGRGIDMNISIPPPSCSDTATSVEAMTPRSKLSRWLNSIQKPKYGSGVVGCRVPIPRYRSKKRRQREGGEVVEVPSFVDVPAMPEELPEGAEEVSGSSGTKAAEFSLNLGLGTGLVFLLAKSASEHNKIIKLQKQMIMLLKDIKEDMQTKQVPYPFSEGKQGPYSFTESNSNLVYSDSNYCFNQSTSNNMLSQYDIAPDHIMAEHSTTESDRQSKCESNSKKKRSIKMNQLEEELEVELERMQINVEGESSYVLPQQHRQEFVGENSDPSESYNISFVEASETKEEESYRYGVSPRELERRLHELLEIRQQERIAVLECALEQAEGKLRERDVEIRWWKDTAKLVSQHKEETLFR